MYIGLAHTGIGAAILTVVAIATTVTGFVTKRAAKRAGRRQGDGQ
ncbi:hypothetical protein [Streptomyces sp. KR55]